jgi:hypothetical protein
MRTLRTLAVLLPVLVVACVQAPSAVAKGENAHVVIAGPGLPGGTIELRGDDALHWFEQSGLGQTLFDGPNINGTIRPNADLGPAYLVSLTFGAPECAAVTTQTLYPYAPGGPQIFNSATGGDTCFEPRGGGWWAGATSMLGWLNRLGVPADPARAGAGSQPGVVGIATSGGAGDPPIGVIAGFGLVAVALVAGALTRRRQLRAAA